MGRSKGFSIITGTARLLRDALPWASIAVGIFLAVSAAQADSVVSEETGAVERAIEGRVRDILDGVIKADQYAVYVQVSMRHDTQAIQAYYDERALTTLPGIPTPDPEVANPANNKLYSLIQNKKVIVVLDKAVSGEQELVAKEILKAKLAINEKTGDGLDFRRAEVPTSTDRTLASPQGAQANAAGKTEKWVKTVLLALAITLALAVGLLLWQVSLLRERVDSRAKLKADIQVDSANESQTQSAPAPNDSNNEGGDAPPSQKNQTPSIRESEPVSAPELKEKILTLAVAQPKACSLVARRLLSTREGMRKLAIACEAIGFEYTRQLFDTVSPGKWRSLGEYLRENLAELSKTPAGPVLLEIYTDMLAESMGGDPNQSADGPFDFIHKLSESELLKLFENEEATQIALLAAFWEPEELTHILSILTETKRKQTVLQIARLHGLPKEVVQQAALRFSDRLKMIRSRNDVEIDGSQVVARMLGTVDGTTEEEILKFIAREDPVTREKLRSHYFSFDSVPLVPTEILSALFETLDPTLVTRALTGASKKILDACLAVLPEKQQSILRDDIELANQQGTTPKQETALARKQIVLELRKALKDRGIALSELGRGKPQSSAPSSQPSEDDDLPTPGNSSSSSRRSAAEPDTSHIMDVGNIAPSEVPESSTAASSEASNTNDVIDVNIDVGDITAESTEPGESGDEKKAA